MWFVILGVLLILLNLAGIGFAAPWVWPGDWWKMCWPFGLALLWWAYADRSGLTKKREMDKMEQRKKARRRKSMEALGMNPRERERTERSKREGRFQPSKIDLEREARNRRNKETIARSSRHDSQQSSGFDSKS